MRPNATDTLVRFDPDTWKQGMQPETLLGPIDRHDAEQSMHYATGETNEPKQNKGTHIRKRPFRVK